ncbi:efflux RND transporter periplasmic adaptor subunit [Geotalea uraniireducens]|uniref:Efflux transporter, RND family, MFP subunit n=1 Tax=Geotalea uraniireducens (strain Rf4) TaxID=351605 RepID=A5G9A4_GEOUR|nr:efflux RND transporter periplasmic adaptor subunit [Geotalea uraniireducens]ABQ28372.1 efflux transporter, RND family, MFP subunit [Geotalea uraniireducens Rf4]
MKRIGAVVACLMFIATLSVLPGCSEKMKEGAIPQDVPHVKGLSTEKVTESDIPELLEAVGTVKSKNTALIAARISGIVRTISAKEGDRVARGKHLITLEANESSAAAEAASAAVEEARRGIDEALARKKLADTTFDRFHKLYDEQAVTRQEFDGRQTEKELAAQGLARAEARLAQARGNAKAADAVAGYAKIAAPIAGIVTAKAVDVGMTVLPGMPLITVEEEGNYRLDVAVPETMLGRVKIGDAVRVAIEGSDAETSGRVVEVVPTVDPMSRTFIAKIDLAAKGLRSGVYGRALFATGKRKGVLIPKSAVVERGALTLVWVVDKEHRVGMRLVKTGKGVADKVEILSGLSAGELVVTAGVEKAVDGAKAE